MSGAIKKFAGRVLNIEARFSGMAGRLLNFPRASAWFYRRFSKSPTLLAIELFVALSLSINFYYLVKPGCVPLRDGNQMPGFIFSYLSEHYNAAKDQVMIAWKTRLAAPALTSWALDKATNQRLSFDSEKFQQVFGLYHTAWLSLTFLMLILFRRDALLIMLGLFGGLMYNLAEPSGCHYYFPWDMPSLFFFTSAILLYDRQRVWLLMFTVCLGALFKETTLCCGLLILLGSRWQWWQRLAGFGAAVAGRMLLNQLLMSHFAVKSQPLTMGNATSVSGLFDPTYLFNNLKMLFSANPNHVLFVNAGALLVMLLIPWKNRRDVVLKVVAFSFIIGQFLYGVINEYRIWYELMPLGWMMISEFLAPYFKPAPAASGALGVASDAKPGFKGAHSKRSQNPADTNGPSDQIAVEAIWQGSYRLTIGGFLIATLIMFGFAERHKNRQAQGALANQPSSQISFQQLLAAAQTGDLEAQYSLGMVFQNQKDNANAMTWLQRAAERGHIGAENDYGVLLYQLKHDATGAVQWLDRAASHGSANGQNNLGVFYLNGTGVMQDAGKAAQLFIRAARQGHMQAQRSIGKMLFEGVGVTVNKPEAYCWLKLAALQGDAEAANDLKTCAAAMTKEQIDAAQTRIQNQQRLLQLQAAAQGGNLEAQHNLGLTYHNLGDDASSLLWLQRAAEQGNPGAENDYGALLALALQDHAKAAEWLNRSASRGNPNAQNNLGIFYLNGTGVKQDYQMAAQFFSKAALQGLVDAQKNLGKMYQAGSGVKEDKVEACKWLKLAALQGDKEAEAAFNACTNSMTREQIDTAEKLAKEGPAPAASAK